MNISGRKIQLVLLLSILNLSFLNAQTTWRWLNGSVQSNTLDAVQALDSNIVVAVGDVATIVRTTDGGDHWIPRYHVGGSDNYLSDVVFSDAYRGIAVGQNGTILLTTDAGASWSPQSSGTLSFLSALAYLGNQTWITATYEGTFYRSTNNGISWNIVAPGGSPSFNALQFTSPDIGVAVGTSGCVLRTTDGGLTWQDKSTSTSYALRGAHFFNPDTGIVWGDMGVYFRTTNGGTTWISRTSIPALWKATFLNKEIGYATGALFSNSLYKTTNSGESWTWVSSGNVVALSFANGKTGFGVGGSGNMIRTQDSGKSWQNYSNPIQGFFNDISFVDSTTGVIVGDGKIFRTTDSGEHWNTRLNLGDASLNSVILRDSTGLVAGDLGTILYSTNRGVDWISRNSGTVNNLYGVNFYDSIALAVGDSGLILRSTDKGLTWTPIASGTDWGLKSIAFHGSDTIIIVGGEPYVDKGGLILRSTDKGLNWTNILGNTQYIINRVAIYENKAIAVSLRGQIYISTNYGNTWIGKWLGIQEDLYGIAFSSPERTLITTGSGGVFTTTNGGGTWNDEHSITANWLRSVRYIKTNTAIMVGSSSTILELNTSSNTSVDQSLQFSNSISKHYRLDQNYPNPFNPSTTIEYNLPRNSNVYLTVYDLLGRQVAVLVNESQEAGRHEVSFHATNLASGIYFYRLNAGGLVQSKKMMFQK